LTPAGPEPDTAVDGSGWSVDIPAHPTTMSAAPGLVQVDW
jgi:hypothetical protein